ncbi:hypothetical protein Tco_0831843 [Tanacetum coccineum]
MSKGLLWLHTKELAIMQDNPIVNGKLLSSNIVTGNVAVYAFWEVAEAIDYAAQPSVHLTQLELVQGSKQPEATPAKVYVKTSWTARYRASSQTGKPPLFISFLDLGLNIVAMTKVIKEEFEQLGLLKIDNDLFTYDTQLGMIFNEFNRLSRIHDDLFTCEIKNPTPCVEQTSDATNNDLRSYEWKISHEECEKIYVEAVILIDKRLVRLIDVTVEQWLDLNYGNHKTMDKNIKKGVIGTWLIRSYKRGDDEVVLSDEEVSDLKDKNNNDEHEIAEIFKIETNLFDYETPLCTNFKEFNYLLKVDAELFTHDIERTKTYEDYENELNNELGEPWSNDGVPYEICDHICEPFRFKSRKGKWHTCSLNDDGFCNGGELPGMVLVGYMTYFQDYEWYDELTDRNLKKEALKQKAIYEKSWGNASQSVINFCAWLKRNGKASNISDIQEKGEEHKERCSLFDNTAHDAPVCRIRRFEMIKYSFGQDEEYVAIKECEYDNLTKTNEDACRAYQDIFRSMDEGWVVTRAE